MELMNSTVAEQLQELIVQKMLLLNGLELGLLKQLELSTYMHQQTMVQSFI